MLADHQRFGRRRIIVTGLGVLTILLFTIGGVSFPAEQQDGAKWAQAALIMLWVFVFDISVGVRIVYFPYVLLLKR